MTTEFVIALLDVLTIAPGWTALALGLAAGLWLVLLSLKEDRL